MLIYGINDETSNNFYFFKSLEIKKEINKLDILSFEIPKEYRNIFNTEYQLDENKQSYTIKNIEPFYDGYKIECKQNIDEWLSFFHKSLNFPYKDIETMIKGIIPSGWSYKISGEIKKYRTITADHKSSWEVLEEIVKKFDVEFRIDNNEKILFISEEIGEDKGVFFSDNFNVVDKDISVESFEFATRIIPEGMNGLKINQINDGKDYLENKSYSGKTINYYWKDERYTNIQNLKDEAARKLEVLSRPRITIKLKVKDLSKAIGVYKQEYSVGDFVYLIDKDRKTKERFRILGATFFPNKPFNNEITLANKPLDLVDDVDENIELTKEMWEETRGRFEATEDTIKGYVEKSKRYTDDSFKTYKSEREQTDNKIYESIKESTTYVDPKTGQTQPIVDKQLEIIKNVNGIEISVKNQAEDLDKKISKDDILEDKEIQDALKGKDGVNGVPGKDGKDGMPGKAGADGKTSYMHFAYADSADGVVGFTLTATSGKKYIGFYTDFVKEDSKDPTKYEWSLFKGDDGKPGKDGANGIPGKAGQDGKTPYFHTAWSNSSDGSKDFSTSYAGEKMYIGTYTDYTKEDSKDPKKYTWQLVKGNTGPKGDKGDRGPTGAKGVDGKDGHTLTAEVWMEGEFRNHLTKDINVFRRATYDGIEIEITDSNSEIFRDGGDGVWVRDGIAHTKWGDWNNKNNYLAEKFTIMYKGLKASSFARLDNVNDGEKGSPGKDGKNGIDGKDGKTGKIGQNLLRNSNVPVENKDYNTNIWKLCETPITGETMTFTVKIKMEKDDSIGLYNSGGTIGFFGFAQIKKTDDYQIWSKSFKWIDKTTSSNGKTYEQTNPPSLYLYIYSNGNGENKNQNEVSIEWATLTRGDIPAIEWSPCYADVDDAIKAGKEESEEISRKLIKVESDFKVENNNIKASVSSLSETTERSFVNLKKDMADADVKVETGIKNYVINNYSTKTQTDQKISNEVGSIKTSIGDIKQEITRTKTSIEQTDKKIETKVSKDGFASLVKQEFDKYKVQAKNIDFEGSYVNVKGSFQTLNNSDDVGVKIDYNQVTFRDNRWQDKTFGGLRTTKILNKDKVIAMNLFHYPTGYTGIMYWSNEDKLFHTYISCDKWNYTGNGGITPIVFHENVNCLSNSIRIGNWELVPDGDTLKIKPHDTKAGYIFQRGGLYRYYASGGKDVKTKID